MEIDRYRALICALETGSLSAAAEKLGYTTSGISRMMAALEEENGFSLLIRSRDGVHPTRECEQMIPAIRKMLSACDACSQLSAQIRGIETGSVTIGSAYSSYYVWISQIASQFCQKHPGIQIQIQNGLSTQLSMETQQKQMDLCFLSRREGLYDWIPLQEDPLMAWVPPSHPLAALPCIPVDAFTKESYIDICPGQDSDNDRVFESLSLRPNTQFTTIDSYAACCMVEAGLGLAMNNAINSQPWTRNIKILPLDPPQIVQIGIAVTQDPTPAVKTFLDFLTPRLHEIKNLLIPSSPSHTESPSSAPNRSV